MNIQIFGTKKCFDTKKAERYFKERKISFQLIDLKEKGMSKGELGRICRSLGGFEALLDTECRDQDALALIRYLADEDKMDKLLLNQQVIKTPVVRDGNRVTVGYCPAVWEEWE